MADKKIYRSESDKMIAGVCGGIAEVYDFDPNLIRILVLLIVLLTFPLGLLAYIAAWIIIPEESEIE